MNDGKTGTGRLTLTKETVRALKVRTAVRTGDGIATSGIQVLITMQAECFNPLTQYRGAQGVSGGGGACFPPTFTSLNTSVAQGGH